MRDRQRDLEEAQLKQAIAMSLVIEKSESNNQSVPIYQSSIVVESQSNLLQGIEQDSLYEQNQNQNENLESNNKELELEEIKKRFNAIKGSTIVQPNEKSIEESNLETRLDQNDTFKGEPILIPNQDTVSESQVPEKAVIESNSSVVFESTQSKTNVENSLIEIIDKQESITTNTFNEFNESKIEEKTKVEESIKQSEPIIETEEDKRRRLELEKFRQLQELNRQSQSKSNDKHSSIEMGSGDDILSPLKPLTRPLLKKEADNLKTHYLNQERENILRQNQQQREQHLKSYSQELEWKKKLAEQEIQDQKNDSNFQSPEEKKLAMRMAIARKLKEELENELNKKPKKSTGPTPEEIANRQKLALEKKKEEALLKVEGLENKFQNVSTIEGEGFFFAEK